MINNIPTYLISCDEFAERKKEAFKALERANVKFNYWRGLHGVSSGIATTKVYNYHNNGMPYYISPGATSLIINHLFLYQHCLSNQYEQVVILEDDVQFEEGWQDKMKNMLLELPKNYDLVYLGWLHEGHERKYEHYKHCLYNKINDCIFGTHALLISRKGLKILIETLRVIEKPLDIQIYEKSIPHMNYFLCFPSIVTQKSQKKDKDKIWETTI